MLALIAAAIAARAALDVLRVERQRDRQNEAEREARDASKVAAWVGRTAGTDEGEDGWRVFVQNRADMPIFDARIGYYINSEPVVSTPIWVLPPGQTIQLEIHEYALSKLASLPLDPDQIEKWVKVSLTFKLPDGTRWHRDTDAELTKLQARAAA
jgi:hypothetical protein